MSKTKKITIIAAVLVLLALSVFLVQNALINNNSEDEELKIAPMNLLILGTDARSGMTGRTDAVMLLSYASEKENIYLLSIPRDTRILIKGRYDKINAAYALGGAELARESIEDFLDIQIDYHVVFNFDAFITLVDIVGGIEVDVPVRMYHPDEGIDLQPGLQHLDGVDALAYSRYRYTSDGDIGRAARQQEVVKLLAEELFKLKTATKLPQIIQTMSEYVEHDLPMSEIMKYAALARQIKNKPIVSEVLPGKSELLNDIWYVIPDHSELPRISEEFK